LVLLRFHLAAGVRVALRATVPVASLVIALVVFTKSGVAIFSALGALFFAPGVSPVAAMAATLVCMAFAGWSSRWVTSGLWGWIRHLPASGASHRRAATAGLVVAQTPLLVVVLASGLATIGSHSATTLPRLIGVCLLGWSAAHASLRGTALSGRLLAVLAGTAAFAGSWWLLGAAFLLVAAADALAGRIHPPRSQMTALGEPARQELGVGELSFSTAARVWITISLRALRWRLVSIWWVAALALVSLLLFLNNDLSPRQEALAVRLVGLGALVVMMASLADSLARKRPVWPWSRSLPWSARSRVGLDAMILSTTAIPVLSIGMFLFPSTVLPLSATALFLAVRGAAAIREPFGTWGAPSAQLFVEGFIAAGLVALAPAAALGLVVLLPLALRWGASAERGLKIGRWNERGSLTAGDSQSWSDS